MQVVAKTIQEAVAKLNSSSENKEFDLDRLSVIEKDFNNLNEYGEPDEIDWSWSEEKNETGETIFRFFC